MKVRFLIDENLTPQLTRALRQHHAEIDVLRVGDIGAPPLKTLDPDILRYLEMTQRMLITGNRRSMPAHIADHGGAGGHHWGIFWVRPKATLGSLLEALYLLWEASDAEEWVDRTDWLPY